MVNVLAVALGGAAGSVLRYWLGGQIQAATQGSFPLGTVAVNVLGSLAIGFLYFWFAQRQLLSAPLAELIFVGLLGGFTTFSTFSLDTLALLLQGQIARALIYIAASLTLCLVAVWMGYRLANAVAA